MHKTYNIQIDNYYIKNIKLKLIYILKAKY